MLAFSQSIYQNTIFCAGHIIFFSLLFIVNSVKFLNGNDTHIFLDMRIKL